MKCSLRLSGFLPGLRSWRQGALALGAAVCGFFLQLPTALQAQPNSPAVPQSAATPEASSAPQSTGVAPATGVTPGSQAVNQEVLRQASLIGILNSVGKLEAELRARQEELRSPSGQGRQEEITQQIQEIAGKVDQLRKNFTEIASGVDPDIFTPKGEVSDVDWSKDLREILSPLMHEVRRLTSRPREMDRLNTLIEEQEAQLHLIDQAKSSLAHQIVQTEDDKLRKELRELQEDFDARKQNISTQLGIIRQKLNKRLGEQVSIGESVQNIFSLFFKSRGLNLFFAFFASILFWLGARRFHSVAGRMLLRERSANRGFYQRLLSVGLLLATVFGAVVVFLVTLYFVGDWVLLILALMLILGVVWTSKQAVHQFWNHATLLLNMGSCREGERVVYNGIPYQLRSLSLFCNLVNPLLSGGDILLPIRDMSTLRSRPFSSDEPWFPTQLGDWILFDKEELAVVEFQSTEVVRVVFNGGTKLEIPSKNFLENPPRNISSGFRQKLLFGLDYKLQPNILVEVPKKLQEEIRVVLKQDGYLDFLQKLEVDFEEAGPSSLNLTIEADFSGAAAKFYNDTRRTLNAACLQACNKYAWNIPFPQMSLHFANSPGNFAA